MVELPMTLVIAALVPQEHVRSVESEAWEHKLLTSDATDVWELEPGEGYVVRAVVESSEFDPTIALVHITGDAELGRTSTAASDTTA